MASITIPITIHPVVSTSATYQEVDNPPDAPVLPGTQVGAIIVKDANGNGLTPTNWPYGVVAVSDNRFQVDQGGFSGYTLVAAVVLPIGSPSTYQMTMTTSP